MTTELLTEAPTRQAEPRPAMSGERILGLRCRNCRAVGGARAELRLRRLLRAAGGRLRPRSRGRARRPGDHRRPPAGHLALPRAAAGDRAARARPRGRLDAADPGGPARADARHRSPPDQGRHPQPDPVVQGPGRRDRRGDGGRVRARRRSPAPRPATWPGRRPPLRRRSGCRPTCSSRPISSRPRSTTRWPTARRSSRSTGPTTTSTGSASRSPTRLGWGFVNVNLRPFYAEGSKTLAFEIAEALGWRLPDVIVAPIASGAMFTKLAKGFDELAAVGLIERTPVRFVGGQAAGCAPVATAFAAGDRRHRAGPGPRHDRPLAGDRQPGRRPLLGRAGAGERRLGRGDLRRGDRGGDPAGRNARGDLPRDGRRGDPGRSRGRSPARRDPSG